MNVPLTKTFIQNWEGLGGTWEHWENPIAARLALLRFLHGRDQAQILAWQPDELSIPGLSEALKDTDITLLHPYRRNLSPEMAIGLTSADAALANTGSLVMAPAAGRSWLPAFIPIHHVVLLPTGRIYANMRSWRQDWLVSRARDVASALIITGPSFSDDIELHRHYGMFGPRYIHIILFDE